MSFIDIESNTNQIQHRAGNIFLPDDSSPVPPVLPPTLFSYTGDVQTFVVPTGVTLISATGWGGAGGGGFTQAFDTLEGYGMGGAAGGFVECDIPVTPGETLTVIVGGGGYPINTPEGIADGQGGYGGGGNARRTFSTNWGDTCGGGGGGYSGIFRGATPLVIAGGGGGGGILSTSSIQYNNGCGGGLTAVPGQSAADSDGGSAGRSGPPVVFGNGGASAAQVDLTIAGDGAAYIGGNGAFQAPAENNGGSGGGGGAGYAGGGGGGVSGNVQSSGGGGGSSYFDGSCINVNTQLGVKNVPPQTANPFYISGVAAGGVGGTGPGVVSPVPIPAVKGGDGYFAIDWIDP